MTAMSRHLKEDVHKDPRELEREADEVRNDLEHTLEALEARISPDVLVDRTVRIVRENAGDFGRNLATQVRNNPVPTILAGAGIAWLMIASDRPPRERPRQPGQHSLGERVASAAQTTRSAMHSTRAAADRAAARAGGAARSLRGSYTYMGREQPLTLGALAIAAGALLGALLPSTETEDEWLGEASDEATDRLKSEAGRRWEDAKASAADAAEAAERAMARDAGSGAGERRAGQQRAGQPAGRDPLAPRSPGLGPERRY